MVMRARRPRRGAHVFGSGPGVHHGVFAAGVFQRRPLRKDGHSPKAACPSALYSKTECTVPLELYLTAEESQGEVKLLRVQNGQSVMLFSGDSAALGFAEIYIGTLTAEESMTFTVQCGEGGNAKLHIHGEKQENAAGEWIVRASLLFGWGVLAVGGSALLIRRIQNRRKKP